MRASTLVEEEAGAALSKSITRVPGRAAVVSSIWCAALRSLPALPAMDMDAWLRPSSSSIIPPLSPAAAKSRQHTASGQPCARRADSSARPSSSTSCATSPSAGSATAKNKTSAARAISRAQNMSLRRCGGARRKVTSCWLPDPFSACNTEGPASTCLPDPPAPICCRHSLMQLSGSAMSDRGMMPTTLHATSPPLPPPPAPILFCSQTCSFFCLAIWRLRLTRSILLGSAFRVVDLTLFRSPFVFPAPITLICARLPAFPLCLWLVCLSVPGLWDDIFAEDGG
mmetsp:Transcript_5837/g.12876  ORF Transcript_5837/g.12876 Transcript_5837/m.12876 type:complete len:284 (-) Transcript_5837:125-976(-)